MKDSKLIAAVLIGAAEVVDDLREIIPDFGKAQIPTLEGISINEIEGGEYDRDYELVSLCTRCNGTVSHIVGYGPKALKGDTRHRAPDCNCRGQSTAGYYIPHVTFSKLFGPSFTPDPDMSSCFGSLDRKVT